MIIGDCEDCGKRCRAGSKKCASCETLDRKASRLKMPDDQKPIAKVSDNQGKLLVRYQRKRKVFLRGKKCQCKFPHNCSTILTVHHMQGRVGYADEWARENEMPLLLDERFWLPACLDGHTYIEEHKKWACENGYSFLRVSDPVFRISNLKP
jgi:hypothetical protein